MPLKNPAAEAHKNANDTKAPRMSNLSASSKPRGSLSATTIKSGSRERLKKIAKAKPEMAKR